MVAIFTETQLLIPGLSQRWEEGDDSYRPASEPIRTSDFEIATLEGKGSDTIAKDFIQRHHYSRKYVAARWRFGLYRKTGELCGVCVFSEPYGAAVTPYFPDGPKSAPELGRLVLLPEVAGNGESWFVGEAFRRLKKDGVAGVISYSDPIPRTRMDGTEVKPGHLGGIYWGLGARFEGRATARTLKVLPDGTALNERSVQKVRKLERGWEAEVERLVALGAPPFDLRDPHAWVRATLEALKPRKLPHPGNYRYVWGFTPALRRALPPNPKDYPRIAPPPAPKWGRRARAA